MTRRHRIHGEGDDTLLATGSTKHACIDHAGRVARMPKILHDALAAFGT